MVLRGATVVPARIVKVVQASVAYFFLVFTAGLVLGPVRVLWVEPRVGARIAELIEAPIMLVVIVCAARWIVRRFLRHDTGYLRVAAGALALVLVMCAELALVVPLRGETLQDYFATRDPVSATVYYAILVIFAAMPLFVYRK